MCLCAIKWHRLFACVVDCCFLFISYFLYSILVWVPIERYHIDEHKCQETEKKKTKTIFWNEEELTSEERTRENRMRLYILYYVFRKIQMLELPIHSPYLLNVSQCRLLTLQSVFFSSSFLNSCSFMYNMCMQQSQSAHFFPFCFFLLFFRFRLVRSYGL